MSATPADMIRLTGLSARGFHGVLDFERQEGQLFSADVLLTLAGGTARAAASDDLTQSVDYSAVAALVVQIIEGEPVNLIETLAERIAQAVLGFDPVSTVEVTVHKPQAPLDVAFDDVSVTITRSRQGASSDAAPAHALPAEAALVGAAPVPASAAPAPAAAVIDEVPAPAPPAESPVIDQPGSVPAGSAPADSAAGVAAGAAAGSVAGGTAAGAAVGAAAGLATAGAVAGAAAGGVAGTAAYAASGENMPLPAESAAGTMEASAQSPAEDAGDESAENPEDTPADSLDDIPAESAAENAGEDVAEFTTDAPADLTPEADSQLPAEDESQDGSPASTDSAGESAVGGATASLAPEAFLEEPDSGDLDETVSGVAQAAAPEAEPPALANILDVRPQHPAYAVLALGGNIGTVLHTLRQTVTALGALEGVDVVDVAPLARTAAVTLPGADAQPDFLNTVVTVRTTLSPRELLAVANTMEDAAGRVRVERHGPRTLDVDVISYEGVRSDDPLLTLPHPRAAERAFVLMPWAQADPYAELDGRSVADLAQEAPDREGVRWMALDWMVSDHLPALPTGQFVAPEDVAASAPAPAPEPAPAPGPEGSTDMPPAPPAPAPAAPAPGPEAEELPAPPLPDPDSLLAPVPSIAEVAAAPAPAPLPDSAVEAVLEAVEESDEHEPAEAPAMEDAPARSDNVGFALPSSDEDWASIPEWSDVIGEDSSRQG